MTGNPKTDATPTDRNTSPAERCGSPTAGLEVIYGSANFQVRIWNILPGGHLDSSAEQDIRLRQYLLISGSLEARCECGNTLLKAGQRLESKLENGIVFENSVPETAVLLEVCWGTFPKEAPLPEVTENRPWGSFTVLKDEPTYKLKQLMVRPGNRLSLQRHEKREEHWFVTGGKAEVTLDAAKLLLDPQQYVQIPRHGWHRLTNPADAHESPAANVEIIELQLGDYFGEDDIERREDDYGRA